VAGGGVGRDRPKPGTDDGWPGGALGGTPDARTRVRPETGMRQSGFQEEVMKRILEIGGFISGAILIAFGVAVIALGASGRATVNDSLKQEKIVGTPDMTPALIKQEATQAGLTGVKLPTRSVAGKAINNGTDARTFA